MKGRKRKLGYVTVSTSKTTEARAVPLGTSAEKRTCCTNASLEVEEEKRVST